MKPFLIILGLGAMIIYSVLSENDPNEKKIIIRKKHRRGIFPVGNVPEYYRSHLCH